jgi:hypothetical protein
MVIQRPSLIKPNLNTPFHIDFSWWKENDNNWRIFLFPAFAKSIKIRLKTHKYS